MALRDRRQPFATSQELTAVRAQLPLLALGLTISGPGLRPVLLVLRPARGPGRRPDGWRDGVRTSQPRAAGCPTHDGSAGRPSGRRSLLPLFQARSRPATHAPQLRYHGPIPMNPTPQLVESLPASAAMLSRTRFRVLALISAGTMINYLDRTVLGVAAPHMATDLHISPAVMGIVFSAFSWSYAAAQIPGGWLLDRIGTRLTYFLAVTFWSLFTLVQGFANGIASLSRFASASASAKRHAFRPTAAWSPPGSASTNVLRPRRCTRSANIWVWPALVRCSSGSPAASAGGRFSGWWAPPASSSPASGGSLYRDPESAGPAANPVRTDPDELDADPPASPLPPGLGRQHRTVRRQFHARLLPDLVPDLPRQGAAHGLDARRILCHPAIPGRGLRRPPGRLGIRHAAQAHRFAQPGSQAASHRRPLRRIHHHPRQLCDRRCAGDRDLLRSPSSARA